jgi:hypothetical protein
MSQLDNLKNNLVQGHVYRRADLNKWSNAVDRHLEELVTDGTLTKLSQGLYYYPKETRFGTVPPNEETLVKSFLKTDKFLMTTPNAYNSLGLGTTQLHNKRVVYNSKRNGSFKLGSQLYYFKFKTSFPAKLTKEFLMVDLVNNLESLAEEKEVVLKRLPAKAQAADKEKLTEAVREYGGVRARKFFSPYVLPE